MMTLKQSVELMNKIKQSDINDKYNIYLDAGKWIIEEKIISIKGGFPK